MVVVRSFAPDAELCNDRSVFFDTLSYESFQERCSAGTGAPLATVGRRGFTAGSASQRSSASHRLVLAEVAGILGPGNASNFRQNEAGRTEEQTPELQSHSFIYY